MGETSILTGNCCDISNSVGQHSILYLYKLPDKPFRFEQQISLNWPFNNTVWKIDESTHWKPPSLEDQQKERLAIQDEMRREAEGQERRKARGKGAGGVGGRAAKAAPHSSILDPNNANSFLDFGGAYQRHGNLEYTGDQLFGTGASNSGSSSSGFSRGQQEFGGQDMYTYSSDSAGAGQDSGQQQQGQQDQGGGDDLFSSFM